MADAVRDDNQVTARLGSFGGVPTRLKVEHATGYLKVALNTVAFVAPTIDIERAKHDENSVASSLGYDGTVVKPLLVETTNGYLRVVSMP
jgi:hypothetical protein